MNNIKQNFLAASLFAKAQKNKNGNININNKTDETLKNCDSNNNGKITEREIQSTLFDANGDKKISSKDLGIYTAFISFSQNYVKGSSNIVKNNDFDVDGDGELNDSEKALKLLLDSDKDGIFDTDMQALIAKDNKIDDNLVSLLKKEADALDKKINPNENISDRVIDAKTGNVLRKTTIEEDGVVRHYSYTYYEGTKTVKNLNIINESLNTESVRTYNKKGELVSKVIDSKDENGNVIKTNKYSYKNGKETVKTVIQKDENGNAEKTTLYTYDNGKLTKRDVIEANGASAVYLYDENEKVTHVDSTDKTGVVRHYTYSYSKETGELETLKIINEKLNTESYRKYDENGKLSKKTIYKKDENGKLKYTLISKYNENGSVIEQSRKDSTGKVVQKDTTDADGVVRRYFYTYSDKTEKLQTLKIINEKLNTESYRDYDKNGKMYKKTIYQKDENGNVKNTYISKYDKKGNLTEKVTKDSSGTITKKEVININTDGTEDKITYKYLKYEGNYPTQYSVEYDKANGIRTKSTITQRKVSENNKNDYIVTATNFQYTDGKWLKISELNTTTKWDEKSNKEKEGTDRIFYFYDETGNLIKEEKTFSFNNKEEKGKPLKTNSQYQINQKLVTTYDSRTGAITSQITYDNKNITTTNYDKNGNVVSEEKGTYTDDNYADHNLNDITADDLIAEAEKYIGYNRLDGSYSIFGTNGSACATFATYLMYQLGFDLTSIKTRTTYGLQTQAVNEGRHKDIQEDQIFEKLANGTPIEDLIQKGDIYTQMTQSGGSSHTTIVKEASYNKKKKTITLKVIGYESNSSKTGISEETYTIKKNNDGTLSLNGTKKDADYKIGFSDYLS